MIGPMLGGLLITTYGLVNGIKLSFGISIFLCLFGLMFQHNIAEVETVRRSGLHPAALWKKLDKRLKNLLVSDILVRFCEQIPYVFVVIWCLNYIKVSPGQFGILSAVEMMTAALIYIPVASFSDRLERKPFVAITFIFFALFPVILYFSGNYLLLILAFVIRGLKEFGEPTRKAMILDLSVKDAEALTFGLYYFIRDMIVSVAAFIGGFLWAVSPGLNLFTAAAAGAAGTIYFIFFGRGTERIVKH